VKARADEILVTESEGSLQELKTDTHYPSERAVRTVFYARSNGPFERLPVHTTRLNGPFRRPV